MQYEAHKYCVVRETVLPHIHVIGNSTANTGDSDNFTTNPTNLHCWDAPNSYDFDIDVPPFKVGARSEVYLRTFCMGPTLFALPWQRAGTLNTTTTEQANAIDVPGVLLKIENPNIGKGTWNRTVVNSYEYPNPEQTAQNSILVPYTQIRYDGIDAHTTAGKIAGEPSSSNWTTTWS